jgi:hypothetical protein
MTIMISSSRRSTDLTLRWYLDYPLNSQLRGFIRAIVVDMTFPELLDKLRVTWSRVTEVPHNGSQEFANSVREGIKWKNHMEQLSLQERTSEMILRGVVTTIGPSTISGLNITLRHLDALLELKSIGVVSDICKQILDLELSAANAFSKIPLIERWIKGEYMRVCYVGDEDDSLSIRTFVDAWLEKLASCAPEIQQYWNFTNDPILDLYEHLIEFLDETGAEVSMV